MTVTNTKTRALARPGVVELRQYTLRPQSRDTLVELFDRVLLAAQLAAGIDVDAVFADLDDPDRFVWFRSFADMRARRDALHAFYDGPVWESHRDEANATMVDSDDVLLLRPASGAGGAGLPGGADPGTRVSVVIRSVDAPPAGDRRTPDLAATVRAELGVPVAAWVTEDALNDFPRLPVRTGHVHVWAAAYGEHDPVPDLLTAVRRHVPASVRDDDTRWRELRLQAVAFGNLRVGWQR